VAVVAFDYSLWVARYPEFSGVAQPLAQMYFTEATLYLNNTDSSIVCDGAPGGERAMLLNMLTAHIAAMNSGPNGQPASQLVGRIATATEGSVSVGTQNDYPPGTVQWYQTTKYGAAFWAATAKYRTMHYVVSPGRPMDPYWPWMGS